MRIFESLQARFELEINVSMFCDSLKFQVTGRKTTDAVYFANALKFETGLFHSAYIKGLFQ